MIVTERCILCGLKDDINKLMAPCKCYKKSDSSRCHRACLEQILADNDSDSAPTCPACRRPYKLKVKWNFRFMWERCLSVS